MSNTNFFKFLLFMSIILQALSDKIDYGKSNEISDMKTSIFKNKKEKIYYVGDLINSNIIGFSDLDNNKYTDIITYNRTNYPELNQSVFTFYVYYSKNKGKKFSEGKEIFNITLNSNENKIDLNTTSVRNLHVFSFHSNKKKPSFLVSFFYENVTDNNNSKMLHYVMTLEDDLIPQKLEEISSNILIMNKDDNNNLRLLYHDGKKRKICLLQNIGNYSCHNEDFSKYLTNNTYEEMPLSFFGGLGYADITGNCIPDIVLSHENNNNERYIEVYSSFNTKDKKEINYDLSSVIFLNNSTEYGAFVLSRINDKRSGNQLPLLDILIPNVEKNQILYYKNKINTGYKWSKYYCKENKNETDQPFDIDPTEPPFNLIIEDEGDNPMATITDVKIDNTFPTVMRMGDFLGSSNPGILVKQIIYYNDSTTKTQISLFERKEKDFKYYAGFKIKKVEDDDTKDDNKDEFNMGLFYDIAETGSLSFILPTRKGKNHFFFNYRRNIFFVKSKLMNDEDYYFDSNLGATFRYIVTDKKGSRHMDIAYQMPQTSDMNIPLPYSIMGLDDTNNYVEYFQTISGNIVKKSVSTKNGEKNYKENSPIIPNTQMMISKYYDGSKIRWNVDLIVQPMEQIWIFLIIVIFVLLIVLGIIIYLHLKEVKEEQKETNKFKSWFA